MMSISYYLRRITRTMMFWLFVAVVVAFGLRLIFPRPGIDRIETGEAPLEVASTRAGVWVLNYEEHTVTLIDPLDRGIIFTTTVGDTVAPALTADETGAWVLLDDATTVAAVSPESEEVGDHIPLEDDIDGQAQDLAATDGTVWITTGSTGNLVKVDEDAGAVVDVIDVGQNVARPRIVGDSLWVIRSDGFAEYDADTGEELDVVESDRAVRDYAVGDGVIYFITDVDAEDESGVVVALDRETGAERTVTVGGTRPTRLGLDGDQLFVSGTSGKLVRISTDPFLLAGQAQVSLDTRNMRGLTFADERIWIADGVAAVSYIGVDDVTDEPTVGTTVP